MNNSETTERCNCCRDDFPISAMVSIDDVLLCEDCYEHETMACDHCGERIWCSDSVCDDSTNICQACYDEYYTRCDSCNCLIRNEDACYIDRDDDTPYCCNCFEQIEDSRKAIQNYYYKPDPIFHGNGKRFLGVELEIDIGGECSSNARELLDIANNDDDGNMYIKHDGSLEEGMELVTHPMTLSYHIDIMPWKDVMSMAVELGYRSHQTATCGLHVHVNRDSLGCDEEQQEETIGRILFFVENHWDELLKFSRRTNSQMEQWAARYGRKDSPKEQMDHVKKSYSGRYKAINLLNRATIEFRLFRGTLRYNTLIATLQLVHEICEVAFYMSDEEMSRLTWSDFVIRIGGQNYPELVQYLKERRLYVSEPVTCEEDM